MVKKILLGALIIITLLAGGFLMWRYVGYKKDKNPNKTFLAPRLELAVVNVKEMTDEKTVMTVDMLIKNQLPFGFKIDSLQYEIFIKDTAVVKSTHSEPVQIKGADSSVVTLPITIYNNTLVSVLKNSENEGLDSVEYKISATFYTDIIFKKEFNINIKRYYPLVFIPKVKIGKIEVDSLSFKRAKLAVYATVDNKNIFDIKVKDVDYEFGIENNEPVKGTLAGLTNIARQSTTDIEIPVEVNFKESSRSLWDLLKQGRDVNYTLTLIFKIDSEKNVMQNSKVVFVNKGTVKTLMKLARKK